MHVVTDATAYACVLLSIIIGPLTGDGVFGINASEDAAEVNYGANGVIAQLEISIVAFATSFALLCIGITLIFVRHKWRSSNNGSYRY